MNIEEIIYSSNTNNYNKYSIPIKVYILNLLVKNENIDRYRECINYFILNNDINFHDCLSGLFGLNISRIYLNCLNDSYLCELVNNNIIIISKSINLFNSDYLHKFPDFNITFKNLNQEIDIDIIKDQLDGLNDDIENNIEILDNIYNEFNISDTLFKRIYDLILKISTNNINEINKRNEYIKIVLTDINKLVFNNNDDIKLIISNKDELLNGIRVISIINVKIKNLLNGKNDIENIDKLLNDKDNIKEIISIFNKTDSEELDITLYKSNITNVIKLYTRINQYNKSNKSNISYTPSIDIIDYLDELINEYIQISSLLESNFYSKINEYLTDFFRELYKKIQTIIKYYEDCDEEYDRSELLNCFNESIIELIENLSNDSNIESIKIRAKNIDNNTLDINEKAYLNNQLIEINNLLDIDLFIKIQTFYELILVKNSTSYKLENLLNLHNELNTQIINIDSENDRENIIKIKTELNEEIEKNKKLLENIEIDLKKLI